MLSAARTSSVNARVAFFPAPSRIRTVN